MKYLLMILLTCVLNSTVSAQGVLVPVTTYVPQQVVTHVPVATTVYQPVVQYYVYNPIPLVPVVNYQPVVIEQRRCLFGVRTTTVLYPSVNYGYPAYPVWKY